MWTQSYRTVQYFCVRMVFYISIRKSMLHLDYMGFWHLLTISMSIKLSSYYLVKEPMFSFWDHMDIRYSYMIICKLI